MKRNYVWWPSSKVELRLVHSVGYYYDVEYRVLDIDIEYQFMFFKWTRHHKNTKWIPVIKYSRPITIDLSCTGDPSDEYHWNQLSYRADDTKKLEHFKKIKSEIKTYRDFNLEFGIDKMKEQYEEDRKTYEELLKKSKETINSI